MRPKIKRDTLEYNTAHISLRGNSDVEELLMRLPGLQIDAEGNIVYNGEKIQHLLVDGEDIFASAPTLVTRTFKADKIARVQILDRKSDQAIFTGIDDGIRTKTINLVLKDESKNSYFGKVEVGANTDKYYNADAAIVRLQNREQITALALASNTGVTNFASSTSGASARVSFFDLDIDALGASAGTGTPEFMGGGIHYANSWDGPNGHKTHLLINDTYDHIFTQPVSVSTTVQAMPTDVYTQVQQSRSINRENQHFGYAKYSWTSGSNSALDFTANWNRAQGSNQFSALSRSSFNGILANDGDRIIRDETGRLNAGGSISWRTHPGRNPGRSFSTTTDLDLNNLKTNGFLYSENEFYQTSGMVQQRDTVAQRKSLGNHTVSFANGVNYTEPLWKGACLGVQYVLGMVWDEPIQASFGERNGEYTELIDSLTTHLKAQTILHRTVVDLQGKGKHLSYTIGMERDKFSLRLQDLTAESNATRTYVNWAPKLGFNYTPNSVTSFSFDYLSEPQLPAISQLASGKNNINPLVLTVGNPNLKQSVTQQFRLELRHLTKWIFDFVVVGSILTNGISDKTNTDSLGRQVKQLVNVSGGGSIGINVSISRKLGNIDVGFYSNGNATRSVSFINDDPNTNNTYTIGGGLNISRYVANKYAMRLNTNFSYFDQINSINTASPLRYWTQSHTGSISIYLVRGFDFNTNATYSWQEKTSSFSTNTAVLLWNFLVSRNFAHDRVSISLRINNILDENSGINRTSVNNITTQTSSNILGRYWLLSLLYQFDKKVKSREGFF